MPPILVATGRRRAAGGTDPENVEGLALPRRRWSAARETPKE
ncbi:hypothetical protein [Corynebacterium amycolatum]|nr:hypothetical protein [Corynebacterium amycolatum]